ncbi:hypothetical protein PATSB16_41800 [Pandoraea thiooxydans]|nr:hypothetical protein PATSB16_41800 [Pandoraea thiooxydans]
MCAGNVDIATRHAALLGDVDKTDPRGPVRLDDRQAIRTPQQSLFQDSTTTSRACR